MVTADQIRAIMPQAGSRAATYAGPLSDAMAEFQIDTTRRVQAFLAQVAHESGQLRYTRELASGAAYDTGRLAERLGNTPEADGDGQRYKGRGLIQITGAYNYRRCSWALYNDGQLLLDHPALLEDVIPACRSAAWFWWSNGLNVIADMSNSFQAITRRINGGLNGYPDRLAFLLRAQRVVV